MGFHDCKFDRKYIFATALENLTHKLRLTWNSLSYSKETSLQKCTVMAISCLEIIFHIYLNFN